MGTGIIVCGLNGTGKSTLGKALADTLQYFFIDHETLFFPNMDPQHPYAAPCSRAEAEQRLLHAVNAHRNFVYAAVKGNLSEHLRPLLQYAVLLEVPKAVRIQRMENRSYQKFGSRMLPNGDLYEQEKAFLDMAASRTEEEVRTWAGSLDCPVIWADGTKPVEETISYIIKKMMPSS